MSERYIETKWFILTIPSNIPDVEFDKLSKKVMNFNPDNQAGIILHSDITLEWKDKRDYKQMWEELKARLKRNILNQHLFPQLLQPFYR